MARVVIATGVDGGDPFKNFKAGKITDVLDQFAKRAKAEFARHGKEFTNGISEQIYKISDEEREIGTNDNRVLWTSDGTKPHVIMPRSGSVLAFQENYVNKTTVNTIPSIPGGPQGNTVFSAGHRVEGIEAGNLDKAIAREIEGDFVKAIIKAAGL